MSISELAYNLLKNFSTSKKNLFSKIKLSFLKKMVKRHGIAAFGLPNPGPIALRAIEDAGGKDVLSVRETGGKNAGKFVEIYLKIVGLSRGEPWCQAFVMFRLIKAATELGTKIPSDMPRSGYTPTVANWGKKKGCGTVAKNLQKSVKI